MSRASASNRLSLEQGARYGAYRGHTGLVRWRGASQTRRERPVCPAGARGRATPDEPEEDQGEGFLQNLFKIGTGTQRLKVGEQTPESGGNTKQARSAGGTQRLQKGQGRPAGGGLQRFGLQTSRTAARDSNTVFVAGSTGRLGLRIVRELLLAGAKVRAGARNTSKAQEYADLALSLGLLPPSAAKQLQIVPVDLEDVETIVSAIGNAGKIVQAIGAAESNVLDFGAPKRIDGDGAINLVNAAVQVGVEQFVMVTSLGTGKFGWPAGALNLFGGILVQKRRAEKALEDSGLPYVIVRPGGMERPTDDYKKANNVRLATRDKLFGGQVSRLQVAELVAAAISTPGLAENKVLEVVAEAEAPQLDYKVLLQQHPTEVSQEERVRQRELEEENRTRLGAAQKELEEADEARREAQQIVQRLQDALNAKKAAVAEVEREVGPLLKEAQQLESQLARLRSEAEENRKREEAAKAVLNAARAAQREGKVLSAEEMNAVQASLLGGAEQESTLTPTKQAAAGVPTEKKQPWSFFSRQQQEVLAEEIPKKEIDLKLGKADPPPGASEKRLAEGISQKEIAISTGQASKITAKSSGVQAAPQQTRAAGERGRVASPPAEPPRVRKQTDEELTRFRESREKSSGALAKREADFLARLEADRRQEAAKKAEQAEKRAEEARKKAAELRKAQLAKQEEEQAKAEAQKRSQKPGPKAAQPGAAGDTAAKAKKNAQEARAWIEAWRKGNFLGEGGNTAAGKAASAGGNGCTPTAGNGSAATAGNGDVSENVREAREWIRDWRARSLENKLPTNSSARV